MPSFTAKVDISKQVAALSELEKTQLPFAVAKTFTELAKRGQDGLRGQERRVFTNRNTWTVDRTLYKPADKRGVDGQIQATVFTDTVNRKTGAPDYLFRQDEGGEKVPFNGRPHIAVPTKYLRRMCPGPIPTELRPANLLNAVAGRFTYKGRKGQDVVGRQRLVRGFYFWKVQLKSGAWAIMGRYVADRRDNAYPFYILTDHAYVKKSQLQAELTVNRIVLDNLNGQWQESWRQIRLNGIRLR